MSRSWAVLVALGLMFGSLGLARAKGVGPTSDSLDTVKTALHEGKAKLIDVREPDEWAQGHLKEASLVPLSKLKSGGAQAASGLDKAKPLYVHCRSGKRSLDAAQILKGLGFDVRPLKDGYDQLVAAGFTKAP